MSSTSNTDSTASTLRKDRVRLAVLMAPKPGLSFEEFDRYWLDVHANVFSSIAIAKRNLLKYEQFHLDPKYDDVIAAQSLAKSKSPFRGIAIFEATTLEKIFEIFQDEEYLRVVVPDELKFFDHENAQILAGPFATIIDL
ncbi:hypothetical protein BD309DRAFT_149752 [Dichomitus squalens]|uniref:EthD domain-containing protein n=1 Tax=Dichomitus squalens TaxID=114155 RepID=A0A4Q9QAJ7_9APHY|nr:hypothetical protein BD311DRAFT_787707 [Dichomitus squalens]TBU42839.1 hypothetical protein BD309DRAFT_149752 [Dichomitus squalens]TBU64619.1 hypothetical protein BD310DRAFT_944419 [Dichomitus squalens]